MRWHHISAWRQAAKHFSDIPSLLYDAEGEAPLSSFCVLEVIICYQPGRRAQYFTDDSTACISAFLGLFEVFGDRRKMGADNIAWAHAHGKRCRLSHDMAKNANKSRIDSMK